MPAPGTVLGLDTSGPLCDAALWSGGRVIARAAEAVRRGHEARLPGIVSGLLADAGLTPADLDRIGVIVGPGSFTGLRVAVSFAIGLALPKDVPVVGVTSLEAVRLAALQARPWSGPVLATLPAKTRPPELSWWTQGFDAEGRAGDPVEADAAGLVQIASRLGDGVLWVSAPAPDGAAWIEAACSAAAAAEIAAQCPDPEGRPPRPVYVRPPDATPPRAAR